MSRQAVSKWENGQTLPDILTMTSMAELFNVTLDQLVYGDNGHGQVQGSLTINNKQKENEKLNLAAKSTASNANKPKSDVFVPSFLSEKAQQKIREHNISRGRFLFHVILFLVCVTIVATLIVRLIMAI